MIKAINCQNGVFHQENSFHFYKHLGIYSYRKDFLLHFSGLPQSILEKTEKLEQLRALENGYKIKVVKTKYDGIGVDTEEDLEKVIQQIARAQE